MKIVRSWMGCGQITLGAVRVPGRNHGAAASRLVFEEAISAICNGDNFGKRMLYLGINAPNRV